MAKDKIVFNLLDSITIDKMEEKREEFKRGRAVRVQVMATLNSLDRIKELDARILNFGIKLTNSQLINLCIRLADFSQDLQKHAQDVILDDKRRMMKDIDELIDLNNKTKIREDEYENELNLKKVENPPGESNS